MERTIRYSNSYLQNIDGLLFLHLNENDCYHTGFAYGQLLLKMKHPIIKLLKNPLIKFSLACMHKITSKNLNKLTVPEDYKMEIKGYSDATGIKYEHLFFTNFVFDLLKTFGFHCTTFMFFKGKRLVVGRNTDLMPFLTKLALRWAHSIVVQVSIPNKMPFIHISLPFFVGVMNGVNAKGIGVNSHQILFCKEEKKFNNLATPLLIRNVLENASALSETRNLIKNNLPARSLNLIVGDAKEGRGWLYELNPSKSNIVDMQNDKFMCATTHFQSQQMGKLHYKPVKGSQERLKSLVNLLNGHNEITIEKAIKILQDTSNGLQHDSSGYSITNHGTFQSFVFDVAAQELFISNGRRQPVSKTGNYVKIKYNFNEN